MEISRTTKLVLSSNQVSACLSPDEQNNVIILGLRDGLYFELNEVGAKIWGLLQEPRTVESVVNALLEVYDVPRADCEADVLSICEQMLQRGLLERVDAKAS